MAILLICNEWNVFVGSPEEKDREIPIRVQRMTIELVLVRTPWIRLVDRSKLTKNGDLSGDNQNGLRYEFIYESIRVLRIYDQLHWDQSVSELPQCRFSSNFAGTLCGFARLSIDVSLLKKNEKKEVGFLFIDPVK